MTARGWRRSTCRLVAVPAFSRLWICHSHRPEKPFHADRAGIRPRCAAGRCHSVLGRTVRDRKPVPGADAIRACVAARADPRSARRGRHAVTVRERGVLIDPNNNLCMSKYNHRSSMAAALRLCLMHSGTTCRACRDTDPDPGRPRAVDGRRAERSWQRRHRHPRSAPRSQHPRSWGARAPAGSRSRPAAPRSRGWRLGPPLLRAGRTRLWTGTAIIAAGTDRRSISRPKVSTAPSPPAPSATCRDGTWSFSHTHRGTCSRHGGVAHGPGEGLGHGGRGGPLEVGQKS